MYIKTFLLFSAMISFQQSFGQTKTNLVCISDTSKIKTESGLYFLIPHENEEKGFIDEITGKFYCIDKNEKVKLNQIDSSVIGYNNYNESPHLNFYFNKTGTKELAAFTKKYLNKEVGFIIHNKLQRASRVVSEINGGEMTLDGNFTVAELIMIKGEIETAKAK